jgi:serine/threonine protein kinase
VIINQLQACFPRSQVSAGSACFCALRMQSVMGLNHIHGKKIIHRDIKALNLFLDAAGNIKAS